MAKETAVLAALFALLAAPAAAQTPLEHFDALCVKTAGEPAAVAAAAAARGWIPVQSFEGSGFQYLVSSPDQRDLLFWGEEDLTIGGEPVARRACSLGTPNVSGGELATATSAWLNGARPQPNRFGNPEWGFALNRAHTEIPNPASYSEDQLLFMLRQLPIALLTINESGSVEEGKGEPLTMMALTVFALR